MSFKVYTERHIRGKILTKVDPKIRNRRSPHWIGEIVVNGILISTVKIPNTNNKEFRIHKAKKLARSLCVDADQYNDLMDCPMRKKHYYQHLNNLD